MTLYRVSIIDKSEWQESVLDKDLTSPLPSPSKGDRYLVYGVGLGSWLGQDENIAEYSGSDWLFIPKREGMIVYVKDEDQWYSYTTSWVLFGSSLAISTSKFEESIHWNSVDGYTIGGDSGYSVLPQGASLLLRTGSQNNRDAYIYSKDRWWSLVTIGKLISIEFLLYYINSSNANVLTWLRMEVNFTDPPNETATHFGWRITGKRISASNADGSNRTMTDTGIDVSYPSYDRLRLRMNFIPGEKIEYYINNILKATHTTNLPTISDPLLHFQIRTLEGALKEVLLGRVIIAREY